MDTEPNGTSNRNKLLLYAACILLVIRIIVVNLVNHFLSPTPNLVIQVIDYIEFLIVSIYLLFQPNYLYAINLDKVTFVLFIFAVPLAHLPTSINLWEVIFFLVFVITAAFLLVRFFGRRRHHSHFGKVSPSMIIVGTMAGVIVFICLKILPFFLFTSANYRFLYPFGDSLAIFLPTFIYQLGRAVIFEEILFRGMIVGFMKSMGWTGVRIIILQALLFWIAHMTRVPRTYFFFIELPIIGIILGYLTLRTKSLLPAIIVHGMLNSLFVILAVV